MKKAQRKPTKAARRGTAKPSPPVAKKAAAAKSAARSRNARSKAPAATAAAGLSALQRRLQTLEDIMEITRLKAAYCDSVDGGWNRRTHNGEAVASLFVDDGVWDVGGGAGRGEGHDGIVKLIDSFQHMPFAFHRVSNPVIHVDGDQATGKWHLIAYLSQPDGIPVMYFGVYNDRFVRTPQGWKFKLLTCDTATLAPFRDGWSTGDYYKERSASASENGPRTA
jgi:hypothetical protein